MARKPLLRIPFTDPFPAPSIIPRHATTPRAAAAALQAFLTAPLRPGLPSGTVILTGAGLSVASGLADYRGANGTYRVNKTYRPIYFHEFIASHEARKRYWARSFLGWSTLQAARPNISHYAVRDLARLGLVHAIVTQNVDSFHRTANDFSSPSSPDTVELHGYLRAVVCTTCAREYPRDTFQDELARLNPAWAAFLAEATVADQDSSRAGSGAVGGPSGLTLRGIRANPDGDVDLPDAPYTTFRYPPCPHCLAAKPPVAAVPTSSGPGMDTGAALAPVQVDADGAWVLPAAADSHAKSPRRAAGILKPAVVMFGETIAPAVKHAAEAAVNGAGRMLVLATSLATYSAWRLAKRAHDRGMPIAIVNVGGVRGENDFFTNLDPDQQGAQAVRVDVPTDTVLPMLVEELQASASTPGPVGSGRANLVNPAVFRDMLS